jgi:hypothetical protein
MIRLFRSLSDRGFTARSFERDTETDSKAVQSVVDAINSVLERAEAEQTGLRRRMDEVISLAAVVGGNDADEFLTRSGDRSAMLRDSDTEMKRGLARLDTIEKNISHFRFLKTVLQSRFPGMRS